MKRVGIAIATLGVLGAAVLALRPRPAAPTPPDASPEQRTSVVFAAPIPARDGRTASISGVVVRAGAPVGGAIVTATLADDDSLSKLELEGDGALADSVAERRGDVVPVARTRSAADGTFVLTGLGAQDALALWADTDASGTALVEHVDAGTLDVKLELSGGALYRGHIWVADAGPATGAWVTLVHKMQSRFFDTTVGKDGTFAYPPLPAGAYWLVAGRADLLSGSVEVDSDGENALTLQTPLRLTGTVEHDGRLLANAELHLNGFDVAERETSSATDGTFVFNRLRPGTVTVRAQHGHLHAAAEVSLARDPAPAPLRLSVEAWGTLSGHITCDGKPPLDAELFTGSPFPAALDAGGAYTLDLEPGAHALDVRATGCADRTQPVDVVEGLHTLDLALAPEALIAGVVVDAQSQAALAQAMIRLNDAATGRSLGAAGTGDDGAFAFPRLQRGRYVLSVELLGHLHATVTVDAPAPSLRVPLEAGLTLRGVVIDDNGRGADAPLALAVRRDNNFGKGADVAADGTFAISGLTPGEFRVLAVGHKPERSGVVFVTLPAGAPVRVTIKRHELAGTVVDERGVLVAGAEIRASGVDSHAYVVSAPTGADGRFSIALEQGGLYELHASKHEQADLDHVTLATAGDAHVRVAMKSSPRVRGRVVDADLHPVRRFWVDGTFFEGPLGAFDVAVRADQPSLEVSVDGLGTVAVPLSREKTELGDIVVGVGRTVKIRVLHDEAPIEQARVSFEGTDARTGADGLATIKGVPAHPLDVRIRQHGWLPARVTLGADETEKTVTLARAPTLVVSIVDANGRAAGGSVTATPLEGGETIRSATLPDGVLSIDEVWPGSWHIVATGNEVAGRAESTVTITDAPEQRLELVLREGSGRITLQLAPGPGTWVPIRVALVQEGALGSDGPPGDMIPGDRTAPMQFELVGLQPGDYDAIISFRDGAARAWASTLLTIAPGVNPPRALPVPQASALHRLAP